MTQTKLICHKSRVPLPVSVCLSHTGISGCWSVSTGQGWVWFSLDIMTSPYVKLFCNDNGKCTSSLGLYFLFFKKRAIYLSLFSMLKLVIIGWKIDYSFRWTLIIISCFFVSLPSFPLHFPLQEVYSKLYWFTVYSSKQCSRTAGTNNFYTISFSNLVTLGWKSNSWKPHSQNW